MRRLVGEAEARVLPRTSGLGQGSPRPSPCPPPPTLGLNLGGGTLLLADLPPAVSIKLYKAPSPSFLLYLDFSLLIQGRKGWRRGEGV